MFNNFHFEPATAVCVLCGGTAKMGGVYYHCEKCDTLGNISADGKAYPVSGTAEQLDESRRLYKIYEMKGYNESK